MDTLALPGNEESGDYRGPHAPRLPGGTYVGGEQHARRTGHQGNPDEAVIDRRSVFSHHESNWSVSADDQDSRRLPARKRTTPWQASGTVPSATSRAKPAANYRPPTIAEAL